MEEYIPTEISPGDLPGRWRQRAEFLKEYGDPNAGRLWALAATELDRALKVLGEDALTLVEAAALCGYSADHLGNLVRNGKIPNVGRKHAPRVRRADLPIKSTTAPGRPRRRRAVDGDVDVRSIVNKIQSTRRQT